VKTSHARPSKMPLPGLSKSSADTPDPEYLLARHKCQRL
jgi:hypothetical protein